MPQLAEAARSEQAFAEFEKQLITKYEAELGANKDTNTNTGPYVRKRLITQLLTAKKSDPTYVQELKTRFPTWTADITAAVTELATWNTPLSVRAQNNNAVADQLIWPALSQLGPSVTTQAASGNAEYRRRVATDLIARMRLVRTDNYAAIESAVKNVFPPARQLAGRISAEEYPLFRLELLSLPLADNNRIYYIRNLAIDIQNLMTNNGEGKTIRGQVHNSAGPANVPVIATSLVNYFEPDDSGAKPDPDAIATLLRARRWLKDGDVSSAKDLTPALVKAFGARKPDLKKALEKGDLAGVEKFIEANVRLSSSSALVDTSSEFLPGANNLPIPAATKQLMIQCAQAIAANDPNTAATLAAQIGPELQRISYPHSWANVQSYTNTWRTNPGYSVHVQTALQTFLTAAQLPSKKQIALALTTPQGARPSASLVQRVHELIGQCATNQLDPVFANFPGLVKDLVGTPVHGAFNNYLGTVVPAYRNSYNGSQILSWFLPSFRTTTSAVQSGSSNNATYSSLDVYDKLAELYEEVSALYNGKADIALLERSFPMWAPKPVREGLFRTAGHLKVDDRLYAAKEIGQLRETIRNEIMPFGGPKTVRLANELSVKIGGADSELSAILAAVAAEATDAPARLAGYLAARASATPLKKSTTTITSIPPGSSRLPVAAEAMRMINDFRAKIESGDVEGAKVLIPLMTPHFSGHTNFSAHVASKANTYLSQNPPDKYYALYYLGHFLNGVQAQQAITPGSITAVPQLRPNPQGVAPTPQAMQYLQQALDFARAGDQANFRNAYAQVNSQFNTYPEWALTGAKIGNLTSYAGTVQLAAFLEEFILQTRAVTDAEVKANLTLANGKKASAEATKTLLELRAALAEPLPAGQENLRLIQLDGLLEDISTNLLAALGEQHAEVTDTNIGSALLALSAALDSSIAGGLGDVKPNLSAGNKRLGMLGDTKRQDLSFLPELRELAARVEKLTEKSAFDEEDLLELRTVADSISERVWQTYVDLKEVFQPRLDKAKPQGIDDAFFVDNIIKQGPMTHLKALADGVHAWSASKLGSTKPTTGAALENPKGIRVMSEGRAVLQRIVIADSLADIPKKVVLDENTLLILGTVGNENISMAGSVVINRAKADGAGAGGQFSHIFVWTRNTGIAGVAFENATQAVAEFQTRFADKLAQGEEIYLEANDGNFRLSTVSEAIERGWMKDGESDNLRPGLNTFVRFMVPDGAGKAKPDLESIRINKKRPGKPFLEIEIAYPMARLNSLGEKQLTSAEMVSAGPNGAHADSLVGPKAAVLARAKQLLSWQNVVLPLQAMPFGQVYGLLEKSGALDEIRALEPALSLDSDGFWKSPLMTDGAYRAKQCPAIQDAMKKKLRELLLDASGQPSETAIREIINPLKANPEMIGPDGKLKPLIARSTANAEDAADFNAAGKHKSVANLVTEASIVNAAIEVIASLYNLEAVETRRLFGVDSRTSAMAVLFQPVEQPEISGVLVTRQNDGPAGVYAYQATRGLFGGVHGDAQIQVAELGANNAGNKVLVPYQAAKMVVVDPVNGGVMEKDVDPALRSAANLLTPQQETQLYQYAGQLKKLFNDHINPGMNLDLDIEWMIVNGQIKITQARPLPRPMA